MILEYIKKISPPSRSSEKLGGVGVSLVLSFRAYYSVCHTLLSHTFQRLTIPRMFLPPAVVVVCVRVWWCVVALPACTVSDKPFMQRQLCTTAELSTDRTTPIQQGGNLTL